MDRGHRTNGNPAEPFELADGDDNVKSLQERSCASLKLLVDGSYRAATPGGKIVNKPPNHSWLMASQAHQKKLQSLS